MLKRTMTTLKDIFFFLYTMFSRPYTPKSIGEKKKKKKKEKDIFVTKECRCKAKRKVKGKPAQSDTFRVISDTFRVISCYIYTV